MSPEPQRPVAVAALVVAVALAGCTTSTVTQQHCQGTAVGESSPLSVVGVDVTDDRIALTVDPGNASGGTSAVASVGGETVAETANATGGYRLAWDHAGGGEFDVTVTIQLRDDAGGTVATLRYRLTCRQRTGTGTFSPTAG